MDRYRSPGVATIAALLAPDRGEPDRAPPAPSEPDFNQTEISTTRKARQFDTVAVMSADFSRIGRRCERAVVTAYRELRAYGADDPAAFRACATLYRIHHPEASLDEAHQLVADWIDHHIVRAAGTPTPGCDCD
jgi:hypothetical protein